MLLAAQMTCFVLLKFPTIVCWYLCLPCLQIRSRLVPMLVEGRFIHLFHTCVKHCLPPIFRQFQRSKHCSYVTFAAYPLAIGYITKMAVEIVGLPIQNGDFPYLCKRLPEAYGLYPSESHKSFHIYQPLFMDINITINSSEGKTDPFYLAESSVFWVRLGQGIMVRLPASRLGSPFGGIFVVKKIKNALNNGLV